MPNTSGLVRHAGGVTRCWWPGEDPLYLRYHDDEWGLPVRDDSRLFEKIYAFMQAMGLVNDHLEGCASRRRVEDVRASFRRSGVG